jgi:hypothetical protein
VEQTARFSRVKLGRRHRRLFREVMDGIDICA